MSKDRRLGRGLAALLGTTPDDAANPNPIANASPDEEPVSANPPAQTRAAPTPHSTRSVITSELAAAGTHNTPRSIGPPAALPAAPVRGQ